MWFKSNFTTPTVVAISFCLIGGTVPAPAYADLGDHPCPWDLDYNGTVGASDLLLLLVAWGVCDDPANCPADFDNTNNVGTVDLLTLLAHWGPCP